jgi:hypothetical protein
MVTVTYDKLNEQNHKITELSNVLQYLFQDRSMCDTESCCDLFKRYVKQVREHIDTVDKFIYSNLLTSSDQHTQQVVKNFMSGSIEVKRILNGFTKQWCPVKNSGDIKIRDHDEFINATDELFDIVLKRILDETEHLYPLARHLKVAA